MNLNRIVIAAALVASMAGSALALSKEYNDFAGGPAKFLLTKDEQKAWKSVKSDEQAKAFVDLFWARRDPTPDTPINEFRDQFDEKVTVADKRFPQGRTRGALTDRGKVLLLLGQPARIQRSASQGTGPTIQTPGMSGTGTSDEERPTGAQSDSPKMVWIYDQEKNSNLKLGVPMVEIAFIDQYGGNDWKLERTPRTDIVGLLNRTNESFITQPNLTVAPTWSGAAPAAAAAPAVATPVAPMATTVPTVPTTSVLSAFKSGVLKAAVDEARAGKAAPSKNLFVSWGEFVTPAGDYFVPVSLYVPKSAGLSADAKLTFYGLVENASGETTAIFEEAATLTATKDDFFFDKSLTLTPGKYKGTFGLAQDGKPVATVSTEMNLVGVDKDATTVSSLILSNNLYALAAAQAPTDPFAFGGLKVIPKADRTFRTSDDLWYFFELRNPGVDAATNAPKLMVKMAVKGKATTGQNVKFDAPASEMAAQELKGVPGHFAVGAAIPLETFRPGDYTLTMKVTDQVKNQTYDLDGAFKVVAVEK